MLFYTVIRQVIVAECTNTYTHIHIIVMWQDKALTVSLTFHALTPQEVHMHTQKFWKKREKHQHDVYTTSPKLTDICTLI